MRLHLLPHDAIENVFSHLSTTDIIATASASPFLTHALETILHRSHLVLDRFTKHHFLSCPTNVAHHIRRLSISGRILPQELTRLTKIFTALDDISLNISSHLPSHAWLQFLAAVAPSLTRCAVEFCGDLPGDLILQALGPNCRNLQQLILRFTPHVYALDIEPFLISAGHSLRVLRLEYCIGVHDQLLISIADHCNNLECLCLGGSEHVGDDGILAITQSPSATTLTTLDIRSCMQVTDEGVFAIATSCYALTTLNLWGVCVTNYGVRAVAEGLGVELQTLVIGDCIGVDDTAVHSIADNCDALLTLEMCGLKRITDDAIMALFDTDRTGRLELQHLTIDRCTNITSRGVLAATGLLDDVQTLPTPSANEHPDIRKRKQLYDWTDGVDNREDREIREQRVSQQCRTDMMESCDADSSQVKCYVSNLTKLSAIETKVAPSVWKFIRDFRKELDLVADDCGVGTDDVEDSCCECESSETLSAGSSVDGVPVGQKRNRSDGYRSNGTTNIRSEILLPCDIHIGV